MKIRKTHVKNVQIDTSAQRLLVLAFSWLSPQIPLPWAKRRCNADLHNDNVVKTNTKNKINVPYMHRNHGNTAKEELLGSY